MHNCSDLTLMPYMTLKESLIRIFIIFSDPTFLLYVIFRTNRFKKKKKISVTISRHAS